MLVIQKILGRLRKAIDDYNMIEEGDKIAVGVSGGKDSMTLFTGLYNLSKFYPKKFEVVGITLDMGLENTDLTHIKEYFEKIGALYYIENTNIGKIVFEKRKEENPCSLCANLRRGALNSFAKNIGCNKVALGHHRDDVIETLIMSILYEGRIHVFSPVTYLGRKDLYVIRPMIYTEEKEIRHFCKDESLPIIKNACRYDGHTKRQFVKDMLFDISKETHDVKSNIFGAIKRSKLDGWHNATKKRKENNL